MVWMQQKEKRMKVGYVGYNAVWSIDEKKGIMLQAYYAMILWAGDVYHQSTMSGLVF